MLLQRQRKRCFPHTGDPVYLEQQQAVSRGFLGKRYLQQMLKLRRPIRPSRRCQSRRFSLGFSV